LAAVQIKSGLWEILEGLEGICLRFVIIGTLEHNFKAFDGLCNDDCLLAQVDELKLKSVGQTHPDIVWLGACC